jgi:predicted metal-dependent hydrolase
MDAVHEAVRQLNARRFWDCHETLEDVWNDEQGDLRDFYHGFIQVAAGFLHVQRLNWTGAVRLLSHGAGRLEPYQPVCLGMDVAALLRDVQRWQEALLRLGATGISATAGMALPLVRLTVPVTHTAGLDERSTAVPSAPGDGA